MTNRIEEYLLLRYPMEIVKAEEGGFFAQVPDLPGCMAQGATIEEAVANIEEAKRTWIEVRLEDGLEVPRPHEPVGEYSGRFVVRVPKSLHAELARRAKLEGTSQNQYVVHLLTLALGREPVKSERPIKVLFYHQISQQPVVEEAVTEWKETLPNLEGVQYADFVTTAAFSVSKSSWFSSELGTESGLENRIRRLVSRLPLQEIRKT